MICVSETVMLAKSAKMPLAYLDECKSVATVKSGQWCFEVEAFNAIRRKYRGYAVSESDQFRKGEPISGCCDRADQY